MLTYHIHLLFARGKDDDEDPCQLRHHWPDPWWKGKKWGSGGEPPFCSCWHMGWELEISRISVQKWGIKQLQTFLFWHEKKEAAESLFLFYSFCTLLNPGRKKSCIYKGWCSWLWNYIFQGCWKLPVMKMASIFTLGYNQWCVKKVPLSLSTCVITLKFGRERGSIFRRRLDCKSIHYFHCTPEEYMHNT